ncbi:MAG: serine hydrolase [Pseudomonadota bacterium]
MTSVIRRVAVALGLVAVSGGGAAQRDPLAPLPAGPTQQQPGLSARPALPSPVVGRPPIGLRDEINRLGRSFDGKAGISVVSLKDGWAVDYNAASLFPQQSCSKLWVAITALDAVDRGAVSLNDRVTVSRNDLTLFHQPIAAKIRGGGHTTTVGALLFTAITASDNTANDSLMRSIGGPDAVRAMIQRKGLGAVRFFDGERSLQSKIAGLTWSQSYSIGDAFYKARSALPMAIRRLSFERYINDPYDGASPRAVASALARLKRGELLSPTSTQRLLSTMGKTKTGAIRVRAALKPGWTWSHKTGSGQVLAGRVGGINDIGLLTAPDGTTYAMAIFTVPNKSNGSAQGLMRSATTTLIAAHERRARGY